MKKIFLLVFMLQLSTAMVCIGSFQSIYAAENGGAASELTNVEEKVTQNVAKAKSLKAGLDNALKQIGIPTDEAQKQEAERINVAISKTQLIIDSADITRQYLSAWKKGDKPLTVVEKQIDKNISTADTIAQKSLKATELQDLYNNLQNQLLSEKNTRDEQESQANKINDRREKANSELSTLRKKLEGLTQDTEKSPAKETTTNGGASSLINETEALYTRQKIIELDWELRSFDIRRNLLRAQRQLTEQNVINLEKQVNDLEAQLNVARTEAASSVIQEAQKMVQSFGHSHPVLMQVLDYNKALANETADTSARITAFSTEKQNIEKNLEKYRQRFNSIKEKITHAGLTDAAGLKLRNEKNQLPDLSNFDKRLVERKNEVNRVQLRRIELEDRALEITETSSEIDRLLADIAPLPDAQLIALRQDLQIALREQRERYLPELIAAYDAYFDKILFPLLEKERDYVSTIDEFSVYINERILWIQSSSPISQKDLKSLIEAVSWILNPRLWISLLKDFTLNISNSPFFNLMMIIVIMAAFALRRRLCRLLEHYGRYKTKLSKATLSDTLYAIGITAILAGVWPLIFWYLATGLQAHATEQHFNQAIAQGLNASAGLLFVISFLLNMLRNKGLAEVHFRWRQQTIQLLKIQLLWFVPFSVTLVFILQVTNNQPVQAYLDSLGRLSFILLMFITAALLSRAFHPKTGVPAEYVKDHENGWIDRLKFVWHSALIILPMFFAISAAMGFMYTATELMMKVADSFWILIVAIVTRGIFIRWLNIEQRKLTMSQIRRKIDIDQESTLASSNNLQSAPSAETTQIEETEIDIEHISTQTLKILNNIIIVSVLVGLYWLWADVLPALHAFDNVTLWQTDVVTASGETQQTAITLNNLMTSLLIILVTSLISSNIPGLLEITILQKLPFTPSGRYAITSIARYFIIILGTILTFNALGVGWAKVQWLAAAVTVGLGFGLQEIFANFVSGLIILFERQIRVGDAVTIGNISGTVSRIKMRATTIVDWDRKELIIPNKEFVTGQVINWTLTDTVIRLVIPVGIAYGSDTQKAHDILMDIARNSPYILKDPEPSAIFTAFGDSTLDFELRAFLPNADVRIPLRHELLMQIDQRFREANIEIAFPQRDIHIRSMPEGFSFGGKPAAT